MGNLELVLSRINPKSSFAELISGVHKGRTVCLEQLPPVLFCNLGGGAAFQERG